MADQPITSNLGSYWLQVDGVNTKADPVDCIAVNDITEGRGGRELILCFNEYGEYVALGTTIGAPEMVSYALEQLLTQNPSAFEQLQRCEFPAYVNQTDGCGSKADFDNYIRQLRLKKNRASSVTYAGMVSRNEQVESMLNLDMEALPSVQVNLPITGLRMTTAETEHLNDIRGNVESECNPDCATPYDVGDKLYVGADADTGVTANLQISTDAAVTWAAASADPFGADVHIRSLVRIAMGGNTYRIIAIRHGAATTQGAVAYTNPDSISWTTVNLGGATAGHGGMYGGALWARNKDAIWAAVRAGYIYKSIDAGVTWTAKESAAIHSGDYNYIHFEPGGKYGIAVGAADIIALSGNGGDSWTVGTATGAAVALNCAWRLSKNRIWVGTANGRLYYSNDGGVTYTRRTGWEGDGVGQVRDMFWIDEYTGFIAVNNATPVGSILRTTNGGYTWKKLTLNPSTNAGINKIWAAHQNLVYAVGPVSGTTGLILKATP
jgi:photosystem II stability/assembly factor-like uncharacterized protein